MLIPAEPLTVVCAGVAAAAAWWCVATNEHVRPLPGRAVDLLTAVVGRMPAALGGHAGEVGEHTAARLWRAALTALAGAMLAVPLLGLAPGVAVALALGPALSAVRRRRARRRALAVDRCARGLAQALASSLAAGNSVRGALAGAASSVDAPLDGYVGRAQRELALGYPVDDVLGRLAESTRSPRVEVLAGALLLQRRSGGDLVRLLGELAESFRRDDAAVADARGATTQARVTAWIVVAAPLVVAAGAELLHRGALTGVIAVPFALIVFALATALHVVGGWLVVRIARVAP